MRYDGSDFFPDLLRRMRYGGVFSKLLENRYAKATSLMIAASVVVSGASLAFADEVNTKDVVGVEAVEKNAEPAAVEKAPVENVVTTANTETTAAPAVSVTATAQVAPADEFEQFKDLSKSFLKEYFVNANSVLVAGEDLGKGLCVLDKGTGNIKYMNDDTKVSGNPDGTTVIRGDNKNFYIVGTPKFADDANGDEYVEAGIMRGDIEFKYMFNGSEDHDSAKWIMFKDKATYDKFVKWQDLNVAVGTFFGAKMKHIKPNYTEATVMTGPEKGEVIKNVSPQVSADHGSEATIGAADVRASSVERGLTEASGGYAKEVAGSVASTSSPLPKTGDSSLPVSGALAVLAAAGVSAVGLRRGFLR